VIKDFLMPPDPLCNCRFRLEIEGIETAGFSEVSGLSSEYEVIEYREGTDAITSVRKVPGLRKFENVTLKRGIVGDKSLWDWHDAIANNPLDRRAVVITLLGPDAEPICRWELRAAWPSKYEGPTFNAEANDVAIETLVLTHEGLDLQV
jgi:phage tail-like protein